MADPYKKVSPNDPLDISAQAWNSFIDVSQWYKNNQCGSPTGNDTWLGRRPGIIMVQNDGSPVDRFGVLGITGVAITPDGDKDIEFKNNPVFRGDRPQAAQAGNFCIAIEPIATGAIGHAVLDGQIICKVYSHTTGPAPGGGGSGSTENYFFADILPNDNSQLQLVPYGGAYVLWKESGLGTKWAIVRVGSVAPHIRWGHPTDYYTSGETLTLQPCDINGTATGEPNVVVYALADKSKYTMGHTTKLDKTTICMFILGPGGDYYLVGTPVEYITQLVVDSSICCGHKSKYRTSWVCTLGTESDWQGIHDNDVKKEMDKTGSTPGLA